MTTTVIVEAHCSENIRVQVALFDGDSPKSITYLKDGESHSVSVYDNMSVQVQEIPR